MIIFAHSKCKRYENRKIQGVALPKKSGMDKNGKAPIMGRITVNRTMAQFSCKLSCTPSLWNPRASRLEGKRYPFPIAEHESCSYRSHHHLQDARSQGCEDDAAVCESDPKEAV